MVRRELLTHGVRPPLVRYRETIERAIADIKSHASSELAVDALETS
jgi:sulfate permease, SulP family